MWDDCPELIAALKSALIGQRYSPVVVRNRANLETKRKALEKVAVPITPGGQPSWKRDVSVLAWLDTL
jgi:hypothetical protein